MDITHLVKMANEIGAFFESEPDPADGARAVSNHLRRYWEPRMRKAIVAHAAAGGTGLSDIARLAVLQLESPS
jgi:formate dehydrogenase subunit delta